MLLLIPSSVATLVFPFTTANVTNDTNIDASRTVLTSQWDVVSDLHRVGDITDISLKHPEKLRDPRAMRLEEYLKRQKTELYKYSDLIVELADIYGVDYKTVVAISGVESGFCRINFKLNNCWGYGDYSWPSLEAAIEGYFHYMNKYYFSKGLTTPEKIARVYNPDPEEYLRKLYLFIDKIP